MKPDISVVISTHNRAESLRRCLKSLASQTLAKHRYAVIVVDNASTDQTRVATENSGLENVRYVYEDQPGLSRARNIGTALAHGKYIAFIDDDAEADSNWLVNIIDALDNQPNRAVCIAGQVELALPQALPVWLPNELAFALGRLELGETNRDLTHTPYFAHGCNMALSKKTLEDFGGFSDQLGRVGNSLLSGGEILLQKKIRSAGGQILYCPNTRVRHHVPNERLSKKWFSKRLYWEGYSLAIIETLEHNLNYRDRLKRALAHLYWLGRNFNFLDLFVRSKTPSEFRRLAERLWRLGGVAGYLRLH